MGNVDYQLIGERIKNARRRASLTQEQMAEQLGVSIGYVSQVERGITKISLDLLGKISAILHCQIAELITDSGKKNENYLLPESFEKFKHLNSKDKNTVLALIQYLSSHEEV